MVVTSISLPFAFSGTVTSMISTQIWAAISGIGKTAIDTGLTTLVGIIANLTGFMDKFGTLSVAIEDALGLVRLDVMDIGGK